MFLGTLWQLELPPVCFINGQKGSSDCSLLYTVHVFNNRPYSCNGQYDAVMNAVVTGTKTKWTECSRKDLEFNYVYINSELLNMIPPYLSKKEGTLEGNFLRIFQLFLKS